MRTMISITKLAAVIAAAAMLGALSASPSSASSSSSRCSDAALECLWMTNTGQAETGLVIRDNYGPDPGTLWLGVDHSNAPIDWANWLGLWSGGDGNREPGGLICSTYYTSATVACLTPAGELELQAAGPDGTYGPAEALTAQDLAFLHALEATPAGVQLLRQLSSRHGDYTKLAMPRVSSP